MKAVEPYNAITGLPRMTWRGIEAPPYDMANFSGSFSLAEKRYPYIDGATHDSTGRNPIPMQFKLYFLNTLGDGLFPGLFDDWVLKFVQDGSIGDLEHPLLGLIKVRPKSWTVELVSQRTSGIVMNVTFIESIEDPEDATSATIDMEFPTIRAAAAAADYNYNSLGLAWPDGARTDSLLGLADQIDSMVFSMRLTVEGTLNQAMGFVSGLVENVESIDENINYPVHDSLIALWNSFKDLGEKVGAKAERPVGKAVFPYDTSIDAVAEMVRNSIGELMTLNASKLLGAPVIKKGTTIKYFADKGVSDESAAPAVTYE